MNDGKRILQLILSGVLALMFVQFYLKAREQNIELGFGMQDVVVAAVDIPAKRLISASMLTTRAVAARDVEPGAFRQKIPGGDLKRIVGKETIAPIPAGGQLINTNLSLPNAFTNGVSALVPPGKRAYVLRLGNLDVAKLILPGDHIDILATFTVRHKGDENPSKVTYTILQNILVDAVDKDMIQAGQDVTGKQQTSEGRLLTLEVSPLEAEKLAHANIESGGEISVIVRSRGDDDIRPIMPVSASNMLGAGAPPAAQQRPTAMPRR